jgi:hypothetical protein
MHWLLFALLTLRAGETAGGQIDKAALARTAAGDSKTTLDRVRSVIRWTNRSFEWTYTDYQSRTVDEIIARKGGNCNEQAMVTVALLSELGVRTRRVREINIQPESARRQENAEKRIAEVGRAASVFGLRHNDHVWIEFWDSEKREWIPADPTLGLVGVDQWIRARVGFGARPTHAILPSRDMLVPFAIFAMDGPTFEPRSERYLISGLNATYDEELSHLKAWPEWVRAVIAIQPAALGAFEGRTNLHADSEKILAVQKAYEQLVAERALKR